MVSQPLFILLAASWILLIITLPDAVKAIRVYRRRHLFHCRMCGNCCRFKIVPLTESDIERLEAAGHRDFYLERGELRMKRANGKCVFLADDRCTVHKVRPNVCRDFPFFKKFGIGYAQKASFCPAMEELEGG